MGEREALQKMGRSDLVGPDAVAAATVILVRDSGTPPEILMLKRDSRLSFAGGLWVFPGGRVDPADFDDGDIDAGVPDAGGSGRLDRAERNAAVREAAEEAGLLIDADSLVRYSHWTPPPQAHKRFSTAFFIAVAPEGAVTIDDGEIRDHQWITPAAALDAHRRGEIELAPPTFITLTQLSGHGTVETIIEVAQRSEVEHFSTQVAEVDGEVVALYHGDVGYDGGDPSIDGPRHRLWLIPNGWRYERQ